MLAAAVAAASARVRVAVGIGCICEVSSCEYMASAGSVAARLILRRTNTLKMTAAFLSAGLLVAGLHAQQTPPLDAASRELARDVFKQLIEINTTDSVGSTTVAAEAMRKRLLDAGFPPGDIQVLGPNDRKGNLVARLRGTGARKPILFMCHLDVVEARREDWTLDPFTFTEKDGYFYGR